MKFKKYILVLIILGLIILFAGWKYFTQPTTADYEKQLRENLPVGSTYQQIDSYLTQKEIEHSLKDNYVYGIKRDISGIFITESVQIIIILDEQQRLKSMEIKPIFTGP